MQTRPTRLRRVFLRQSSKDFLHGYSPAETIRSQGKTDPEPERSLLPPVHALRTLHKGFYLFGTPAAEKTQFRTEEAAIDHVCDSSRQPPWQRDVLRLRPSTDLVSQTLHGTGIFIYLHWGGLRGQCRHNIWHTWSVWVL